MSKTAAGGPNTTLAALAFLIGSTCLLCHSMVWLMILCVNGDLGGVLDFLIALAFGWGPSFEAVVSLLNFEAPVRRFLIDAVFSNLAVLPDDENLSCVPRLSSVAVFNCSGGRNQCSQDM